GDDPLGEQESLREFDIRTGGPHRHRDGSPVDADFQRLLHRQGFRPGDHSIRGEMFGAPARGYVAHRLASDWADSAWAASGRRNLTGSIYLDCDAGRRGRQCSAVPGSLRIDRPGDRPDRPYLTTLTPATDNLRP